MNVRYPRTLLTLALTGAGFAILGPAPAAMAAPVACAAQYHLDANGHCQPNNPYMHNPCPAGTEPRRAGNRKGYICKQEHS
jgi:hypothetical protein